MRMATETLRNRVGMAMEKLIAEDKDAKVTELAKEYASKYNPKHFPQPMCQSSSPANHNLLALLLSHNPHPCMLLRDLKLPAKKSSFQPETFLFRDH